MNTCKSCGAVLDFETENGAICDQCRIECTRLTHLLEETKRPLTGREEVEIQLEHQALVKNMTDEELEAHILDLDRKIASFRIKAMDARRERAERERVKFAQFTPEEIENFKREQALKKTKKVDKIAETKRNSAIEAMVNKLGISREDAEKWFIKATEVAKGKTV